LSGKLSKYLMLFVTLKIRCFATLSASLLQRSASRQLEIYLKGIGQRD